MKETDSPVLTPFSVSNSIEAFNTLSEGQDYFNAQPHHSKSLVGNAAHHTSREPAPIDDVPNEILSHILEMAYLSEEHPDDTFRCTISHASSRFRQITLSTPSLWSKYHLTPGNIDEYIPHLPYYLQLSKEHPLDIHLSCFWSRDTTRLLMDLLLPHSYRWGGLSITTPSSDIFSFLVDIPAPLLDYVSIAHFSSQRRLSMDYRIFGGHLPKLTQLVLRNVTLDKVNIPLRNLTKLEIRGYGIWPNFAGLEDILGGSEALQELTLHVKPVLVVDELLRGPHQGPLLLPALRTFTVFTSEWLTADVARLVRCFAAPNLETLLIQEGSGLGFTASTDIMRYSASPVASLITTHCDIVIACRCLAPAQLERLRTLDMRKAVWKDNDALSHTFRGMLSLEKLILSELNPLNALQDLGLAFTHPDVDMHGLNIPVMEFAATDPIAIPSLRTLDIDMSRENCPAKGELAQFIRLFSLPSLSSLILRRMTQGAWEHTVECFAAHVKDYPSLTSLAVVGMAAVDRRSPCSPAVAFPHLQTLSMLNTPSNHFLCRLAERRDESGSGIPWPDLNTLTIYGDAFASRPLLHKVIEVREEVGRPLASLFLDGAFKANWESWEWIMERVPGTVEMSRACV